MNNLEDALDAIKQYKFAACIEVTNGISKGSIKSKIGQARKCKDGLDKIVKRAKIRAGLAFVKSNFAISQPFESLDFLFNIKSYNENALKLAVERALGYKRGNGNPLLSKNSFALLQGILDSAENNKLPIEDLLSISSRNWISFAPYFPGMSFGDYIKKISAAKGLVVEMYVAEIFRSSLGDYPVYTRLRCPVRKNKSKKVEIDVLVVCPKNKFNFALDKAIKDSSQPRNCASYFGKGKVHHSRIENIKYQSDSHISDRGSNKISHSVYDAAIKLEQRGFSKSQAAYAFIDSAAEVNKKKLLSRIAPESRADLARQFKRDFLSNLINKLYDKASNGARPDITQEKIERICEKFKSGAAKYSDNSIEGALFLACKSIGDAPFETAVNKLRDLYETVKKASFDYVKKNKIEIEHLPVYFKEYDGLVKALKQNPV